MSNPKAQFMAIVDQMTTANQDVVLGKMMSSSGLKYKDKVFAFYSKEEMGFRLGPDFDPDKFGLTSARPLSPFKTKPPLKGWFMIDESESNRWQTLASLALEYTITLYN